MESMNSLESANDDAETLEETAAEEEKSPVVFVSDADEARKFTRHRVQGLGRISEGSEIAG